MELIFYLDDYNIINSSNNNYELNNNLVLLKNNKTISYEIKDDISIVFKDEYKDGDEYSILIDNKMYQAYPRFICHTNRFDEEYCPDLYSLGSNYTKNKTLFRYWVPFSKEVNLILNDEKYAMEYKGKGLYEIEIKGDLDKSRYHYEIHRNNEIVNVKDIFAYNNTKDNKESYVINVANIDNSLHKIDKKKNTLIYELSIRDFSSDINAPFINKKKFEALTETKLKINQYPIGIDYLKTLGISHIQIMPVLNFDNDNSDYNWGYNPLDYNSFKWDYVVGNDPYSPMNEFKKMVNILHKNNIGVVLDVVYNHVYKIENSTFHKLFPYYFFRYYKDGKKGDASWCGNETRSESKFLRKYFNLINKRLIKLYDIDGLRFDLAGILDSDSINYFIKETRKIKRNFLMYGEGWNMGDIVPDDKKASINNSNMLEGFGFFNGEYRDLLVGKYNDNKQLGYLCGNKEQEDKVINALLGKLDNFNPNNSINYIECHDNYTFYDRIKALGFGDDTIKDICKCGLTFVLFSKGIPFIHAGQEFLRTKKGVNNSYNLSDEYNLIDWNLMIKNIDIVKFFINLVKLKEKYFNSKKDHSFYISHYYDLLVYSIDDVDVFINPSEYPYVYNNWITYESLYYPNGNILHNLSTFDIDSYSLLIAKKS